MEITVLHNQSLLDVAIQYTGDVSNAFEIAFANDISLTESIPSKLKVVGTKKIDVVNYINDKYLEPATDFNFDVIQISPLGGVGYWEIDNDFEIQ